MLIFCLVVAPLCLGLPWTKIVKNKAFIFPIGFFIELALYQLLAFPMAFFDMSLKTLTWTFVLLLIVACLVSIKFGKDEIKLQKPRINGLEWVYLVVAILLISFQIWKAISMDRTYMSYDDSWYVTWASDALNTGRLFRTNYATGIADRFDIHRAMQSSLIFPASLSYLSGLSLTIVEHTILQVYYTILAYCVYWAMANVLFKDTDNKLIFVILLAVFYIFGHYSHYSTTFRLLGPNYQGKAVLAVSLTPLVFSLLFDSIMEEFNKYNCLLYCLLSIAATSCTLIGTVTIVLNVSIPIVLSLIRPQRQFKYLLYIVSASVMPAFYALIYLIDRFLI